MTSAQKFSVSFLGAVVVFSIFAFIAFSGLFNYIDTTFYNNRIIQQKQELLDHAADVIDDYHEKNFRRFNGIISNDSVKNIYRVNQSREDRLRQENFFGKLHEDLEALSMIRFVDKTGEKIYFSDNPADILNETNFSKNYRSVIEIEESPSPGDLILDKGQSGSVVIAPSLSTFVYRLPVYDTFNVFQGTALFYVSVGGISTSLVKEGIININDTVQTIGEQGYLINIHPRYQKSLVDAVASNWEEVITESKNDYFLLTYDDGNGGYRIFTEDSVAGTAAMIFPQDIFKMPQFLNIILLVSVFLTVFLIIFLIMNLRQDPVLVLSDRIKRFQINLLKEYMEEKENIDWKRWQSELEIRRDELSKNIKKGIGHVGKTKAEEIDKMINKSWDEIISVLGDKSEQAPREKIELPDIEELLDRVVNNLKAINLDSLETKNISTDNLKVIEEKTVQPATTTPKQETADKITPEDESKVQRADEEAELEEPEEMEELEELEADESEEETEVKEEADELEDLYKAEQLEELEAPPTEEKENDEEKIDEDEVAELIEISEAEEAEMVVEIEEKEPEEAQAEEGDEEAVELEEIQEIEEAEELSAVEEAETGGLEEESEEIEEVIEEEEEAELVAEIEEAEGMSETPLQEEETAELIEFEEAEEIDELEDVEDIEEAEEPEPITAEGVFEANEEELEELAELEQIFSSEDIEEVEKIEDYYDSMENEEEEEPEEEEEELEELEELEEDEEAVTESQNDEEEELAELSIVDETSEEDEEIIEMDQMISTPDSTFFASYAFGDSHLIFKEVPNVKADQEDEKKEQKIFSDDDYESIDPTDILEILNKEEIKIAENTEGILEISIHGASEGDLQNRNLKNLVDSVMEKEESGRPENIHSGIEDIFSYDAIELFPADEVSHNKEQAEGETEEGDLKENKKRLVFNERGLDYDKYMRGFSQNESGILKSFVSFTRLWDATTGAIFKPDDSGYVPSYTLGVEEEGFKNLYIRIESELYRRFLKNRQIVFVKKSLKEINGIEGLEDNINAAFLRKALFIPVIFDNKDTYIMLGIKDTIEDLTTLFDRATRLADQVA